MRRISIVVFAVAMATAGCSSTQNAGSAGAPVTLQGPVNDHGTGATANGRIELEANDTYFSPTYIKAAPDEVVSVEIRNNGDLDHTFTIDAPAVDVVVGAGSSGVASFTFPASGAVAFACRFHRARGMQGAFYSKAGAAVSGSTDDDSGRY